MIVEVEKFVSGYCRVLDASRMVEVILENGEITEVDFTGAAGLQYNITNKIGLYLEPDFSLRLNEGTLETYRHDHFGVISARAGIRFNF